MLEWLEKLADAFLGRHTKSSVMTPLLYVLGVCLLAAWLMPDQRDHFIVIVTWILFFYAIFYSYFALNDSNKLLSERYQAEVLNHQRQIMQTEKGAIIIENSPISANPELSVRNANESMESDNKSVEGAKL